jgi:hypothetical protein
MKWKYPQKSLKTKVHKSVEQYLIRGTVVGGETFVFDQIILVSKILQTLSIIFALIHMNLKQDVYSLL